MIRLNGIGTHMGQYEITLIGDTHGKFDHYIHIAKNSEYSIQLGDFGFS